MTDYRDTTVRHHLEDHIQRDSQLVCSCPICGEEITRDMLDGVQVTENRVVKCGELMYIELYHAKCEKKFQTTSNTNSPNFNRFDL